MAAGLADAALGTDSAGSIRIPAACCGVVGHKPTHGLVSLDGCWPLAASFDTGGPLALDVEGCERMLAALVPGFEPVELESLEELEVGVAWTELADPLVRERVEAAVARFPRRRPVELPFPDDGILAAFNREVADVHRELFAENADLYGEDVRIKVERCLAVRDSEVERAGRLRAEYRERAEEALEGLDLVLTPTLPIVAPPLHRGAGPGDLDVRMSLIRFTYPDLGARLARSRASVRPGRGRSAGVASDRRPRRSGRPRPRRGTSRWSQARPKASHRSGR